MSKVDYKPAGFQNVVPYLHVKGADKLMEFMKQAFDAEVLDTYPRPDGTIAHAQLRIGDTVLELADAGDSWPAMPCALHIYVPDADATYKRAVQAGAASLSEPADQMYGERSANVRDICGNNWYIATQIEVLTKAEIEKRAVEPAKA